MPHPNALTLDTVRQRVEALGGTLLSSEYHNHSTLLTIACTDCGTPFQTSMASIRANKPPRLRCTVCAYAGQRASLDEVRAWFLMHGATPDLSGYRNLDSRIPFECRCGNRHSTKYRYSWREHIGDYAICPRCRYAKISGPNSNLYNSTLTDEERNERRLLPWYFDWFRACLKRDNFICQVTGQTGRLTVHHLYNWAHYPEHRTQLSNGITLLRRVHDEFHQLYGKGWNTPTQFAEFTANYHRTTHARTDLPTS